MYRKIRELRMVANLTETQVSNLLNISSYKYRRCEAGEINFASETIILLSLVFQVSLDFLLRDKYSVEDVLNNSNIKSLSLKKPKDIIDEFEKNICTECPYGCIKTSYRVIKRVIQNKQEFFSKNLKKIRCDKLLEIEDISDDLGISKELYQNIETAQCLPDVTLIIKLANYFTISIDSLFKS